MAEITQERADAVGWSLKLLVEACNMVSEDEIKGLIQIGERKHAIDPIIDPTRYRLEGDSIIQGQEVLRAFLSFKQQVKGIGFFR